MEKGGMKMDRMMFIFGNLAPDMTFSYIYRRHTRTKSAPHMAWQIQKLYDGSLTPGGAGFSYRLGVMCHYVCDFLCYPHTPGFEGGASEHIAHENAQVVRVGDAPPSGKRKKLGMDITRLTDALGRHITKYERLLAQYAEPAAFDIPAAMQAAAWASASVYLYAESAVSSTGRKPGFQNALRVRRQFS
jgi:hypothetical protein